MAGIRLSTDNPTWRNARVALTHPTKKLKPRYEKNGTRTGCFACGGLVHERKTVHLDFDAEGVAYVSKEVLKLLQEAGLDTFGLTVLNETEAPPDQAVYFAGEAPIAITTVNKEYGGKFPKLHVIKNRLLRPSTQA